MAIFGRESSADRERAERARLWFQARSPYAVVSVALGLAASVDFLTMILGAVLGIAAIVCGIAGWRDLKRRPGLQGRRLCVAGMALGAVGIVLSLCLWMLVLSHHPAAGR